MEILIQAFGFGGILAAVIAFQCKKHKTILFWRTTNEFLFAVQYLLLGAYTGMAMNLVGCVRNIIFAHNVERKKNNLPFIIFFCLLFIGSGIYTWQGYASIFIIVAKLITTLAYGNKNTTIVRCCVLVTSSSWLVYNLFAGSDAGVICEILTLSSLVLGIIRLDILPRIQKKNK